MPGVEPVKDLAVRILRRNLATCVGADAVGPDPQGEGEEVAGPHGQRVGLDEGPVTRGGRHHLQRVRPLRRIRDALRCHNARITAPDRFPPLTQLILKIAVRRHLLRLRLGHARCQAERVEQDEHVLRPPSHVVASVVAVVSEFP